MTVVSSRWRWIRFGSEGKVKIRAQATIHMKESLRVCVSGWPARHFAILLAICSYLIGSPSIAAPVTGFDIAAVDKLLALAKPGEDSVYLDDMVFKVEYLQNLRAQMEIAPQFASATSITKWPNGTVPYVFNSNVNSTNRQHFIDATVEWAKYAKITFVARTSQTNYVTVNDSTGNSAGVGMQGGVQSINIYNWTYKYIICHEIAHCMGVCHEQCRSDRDTYVTVNTANIEAGKEHNFTKLTTNNPTPYDFGSVMHYGPYDFSANGNKTITPKAGYETAAANMGQRSSLTVYDRQGMASLYGGPNLKFYNPGWTNEVILSNTTGTNTDATTFSTSETIYVDIAPMNGGTIPIPSEWRTRIFVDGVQKFDQTTDAGLAANTYYNDYLDRSIGTLAAGTHTIRVVLDALNQIGETDESTADNERTRTITVSGTSTLAVSASPSAGGSVTGGGTFTTGSSRTVSATANSGYTFVNWTENGVVASTTSSYTFTLNGARTLVANFAPNLTTDVAVTNLSGSANSLLYYRFVVPAGATNLRFTTSGGSGNVNLYARAGSGPTTTTFDAQSSNAGNSETLTVATPASGVWFVLLHGAASYSGVSLTPTYTPLSYTIALNAGTGGTVSGAGTFTAGTSRTVTASPNLNYSFVDWKENGTVVSTSQSYTFTLGGNRTLLATFVAIPQAPTISSIAAQTVNEDGVLGPLAFTVSDPQSPASSLTVTPSSSNTTLIPNTSAALALAGTDSNRTVTVRPAPNQSGTANVTLTVSDGTNTTSTTFAVTVNAVNDPPSFTKGSNITLLEDSGTSTTTGWATAISPGPSNESSQTVSFTVTNNNAALFATAPAVSSSGTLTFTPAANAVGTATVSVTAVDNGGTANGGVASSAVQTFTVTVTEVNDPPTFTKGANQTVLEDSGAKTVTGWATAISPGAPSESAQNVTFATTAADPALFAVQPVVATNGTLTFTPAANVSGSTTITVRASDGGGTANGGSDTSTQTFTIAITAVNDAPSFVKGADQNVPEDSGTRTVTGWATSMSPGPADESAQTISFSTTNTNAALFSTAPAISANGTLTFTPAANAYGSAAVTVTATDSGGTANGGVATSAQTFNITVAPINDPPSFTKGANQTVLEDSGVRSVTSWATAISTGPNESGQTLTFTTTNDNAALFAVAPAVTATGTLTFTPAANANGSATVTVTLQDNGGAIDGGSNLSAPQTFTISVTAVNDPPTFVQGTAPIVLEDSGAQSIANWATGFSAGPADEAAQTFSFTVTNNNATLFTTAPAIAPNGTLSFTPAANANGTATVSVTLTDSGGTANGGVATTIQGFIITVTSVNDAPSFTKGANQTALEDSGAKSISGWATAIASGPANESAQLLNFIVTSDRPELFSAGPAVSAAGALTYTPAANRSGIATISVVLSDTGGTANGGVDRTAAQTFTITLTDVNDAPIFTKGANVVVNEDPGPVTIPGWATGLSPGSLDEAGQSLAFTVTNTNPTLFAATPALTPDGTLSFTPAANLSGSATVTVTLKDNGGVANGGVDTSAAQTFTLTVNSSNDPPTFTAGANQTVLEDTGAKSVTGWATAISPGPANESAQTVSFLVTNDNPALFSTAPAISPAGVLTYTLAANAFGVATVSVQARDNGGVANGGVDTSAPQTFTITVTNVNDPPSFSVVLANVNQTVNEDAGPQTVAAWASNISAGPNESAQSLTFTVTTNNPALFSAGPVVTPSGVLMYTPAPNISGSCVARVTLQDDGGTADGGEDLSTQLTFAITVRPVNDAPSFVIGAAPSVLEESGPETLPGWATAISAGPPDEATQTVDFIVTTDRPELFSVLPAISADGALTFAPAPNRSGTAQVTVKLSDNGGLANGGADTSAPVDFPIFIANINDAPSFAKGNDQTLLEDAGLQTIPLWATGIDRGGPDESGQTLTFVLSSDNPGLFAQAPSITANGTLTFRTAPDAHGTATIDVVLTDDGGTANGGSDSSGTQTFRIVVTPVNDAPVLVSAGNVTVIEDAGPTTLNTWATSISPGPANESDQSLTMNVTNDSPSLFASEPALSMAGVLTFTPAADAAGVATVTITLDDDGGTANGGSSSTTVTFQVTVLASNDAPVFAKGNDAEVLEDAGAQTVAAWASGISAGPPNEAAQTLTFLVNAADPSLFASGPSVSANGTLTFTPAPNAHGSTLVTVQLRDSGGVANQGQDLSATESFRITITSVNDAPTLVAQNVTLNEDAGAQTRAGWAAISAGAANESEQTLTVDLTTDAPPGLFAVAPQLTVDGTLSFTTAADAHGSATVTVSVRDDGGTANGGSEQSEAQTFTITVLPVNDAPAFARGADITLAEESGAQTRPGWAQAISAGPADENTQTLSFVLVNSRPELFATAPVVTPDGTLSFTPAANRSGSASITVRLRDSGGTDRGGVDTSEPQVLTITIEGVNDAPSFVKGSDVNVLEDAGSVVLAGWATAIDRGGADEAGQALTFTASADNPSLFQQAPTVAADGTLRFRSAQDAHGSATVTLELADDGGTIGGGADRSSSQTFVINVGAVNDAPTFTRGENLEAAGDDGPQSFAGWATELSAGPVDEAAQTLSFLIEVDQPNLFSAAPLLAADGTLTFTPALNARGRATVTARVRDSGGTAGGGIDTSAPQTFTITITSLDGEPGGYVGLIQPPSGGTPENSRTGSIQLKLTESGTFTAKLKLAGKSTSLKGRFGNDGAASFGKNQTATSSIARRDQADLQVTLALDVTGATHTLRGTLTEGSATFAVIEAERAIYTGARKLKPPFINPPQTLLGSYTIVFPALTSTAQNRMAESFPQGDGFAILKVNKSGVAKLSGSLADGTKITASAPVTETNRWPLYFASGRKSSVSGFAKFEDIADTSDLGAENLLWFKPAPKKADAYPQGWPGGIFLNLAGAKYTAPSRSLPQPALPGLGSTSAAGNAALVFSDGGMATSLRQGLNLDSSNKPELSSPVLSRLKLKLAAKTGLFQGTLAVPGSARPAKFKGAILQKQKLGSGYFLTPGGAGSVIFGPNTSPSNPPPVAVAQE